MKVDLKSGGGLYHFDFAKKYYILYSPGHFQGLNFKSEVIALSKKGFDEDNSDSEQSSCDYDLGENKEFLEKIKLIKKGRCCYRICNRGLHLCEERAGYPGKGRSSFRKIDMWETEGCFFDNDEYENICIRNFKEGKNHGYRASLSFNWYDPSYAVILMKANYMFPDVTLYRDGKLKKKLSVGDVKELLPSIKEWVEESEPEEDDEEGPEDEGLRFQ